MSVLVTFTFAATSAAEMSSAADSGSAAATATISLSVSATVSMPATSGSSGNGDIFCKASCAVSSRSSRSSTGTRTTFTSRRESGTERMNSRVLNVAAASWNAWASRSAADIASPAGSPSPPFVAAASEAVAESCCPPSAWEPAPSSGWSPA